MSKAAIQWAYKLEIPKQRGRSVASMKAILLCLCWHIPDAGDTCWPGLTSMQRWSGLNRRAVVDALKALEKLELIQVKRSGGRLNTYLVAVGYWLPSATSSKVDETPEPVALRPSTSCPPSKNRLPSATRIGKSNKSSYESPREDNSVGAQRLEVDAWLSEYEAPTSRDKNQSPTPGGELSDRKQQAILRALKAGESAAALAAAFDIPAATMTKLAAEAAKEKA